MIGYGEAWAVAPAGVYFTAQSRRRAVAAVLRFADARAIRRVASLPKTPAPGGGLGIAVSRDGRWLLYTQPARRERHHAHEHAAVIRPAWSAPAKQMTE